MGLLSVLRHCAGHSARDEPSHPLCTAKLSPAELREWRGGSAKTIVVKPCEMAATFAAHHKTHTSFSGFESDVDSEQSAMLSSLVHESPMSEFYARYNTTGSIKF